MSEPLPEFEQVVAPARPSTAQKKQWQLLCGMGRVLQHRAAQRGIAPDITVADEMRGISANGWDLLHLMEQPYSQQHNGIIGGVFITNAGKIALYRARPSNGEVTLSRLMTQTPTIDMPVVGSALQVPKERYPHASSMLHDLFVPIDNARALVGLDALALAIEMFQRQHGIRIQGEQA